MKTLFLLNACRFETTKSIINSGIAIEWKSFVFKNSLKINDKLNKSTTEVTFPLLLMLTLDKKLSFIHLYFGRNNEVKQIKLPLRHIDRYLENGVSKSIVRMIKYANFQLYRVHLNGFILKT